MITLREIDMKDMFDLDGSALNSGLCRWFRVPSFDSVGHWSMYYKPDDGEVEFLVEDSAGVRFYLGIRLADESYRDNPIGIDYLGTKIWPVTKEQFISAMIQSDHCCLDWLLFNQDIWNT